MKVLLLGAGASKSYAQSPTGVSMPVAKDFFKTYKQLAIAENPWVLIGDLLQYLKRYCGVSVFDFQNYNRDIEKLHSEIEEKLLNKINQKQPSDRFSEELHIYFKAYTELIFLFTSVLNEIQNGPVSETHLNLAKWLRNEDVVLSFNWDTLMERALAETTAWNCFEGYYVQPVSVYQNKWIETQSIIPENQEFPTIVKLHGSTNWLTAAPFIGHGGMETTQAEALDRFCVYESTVDPYPTYDGRFMPGYEKFSYGYYPVNLPLEGKSAPDGKLMVRLIQSEPFRPAGTGPKDGLVSIPLIIPPVKNKSYDYFGDLFRNLWQKAEESLVTAEDIVLIGYSFPETDYQSDRLFKNAFSKRNTMPRIFIVNPEAQKIKDRFMYTFGIDEHHLFTYNEYFSSTFDLNRFDQEKQN